ncbi:DUF2922 domain-containing protein [Selenomonas sp. F0473]|uniref:DUF2922 domain-containing protein n=1 Tax=Selenomonas sp. F0473 TaxID=999423 RepID=UPI00029E67C3|nr:DUF2922 domain-containing protein [Selenomonas sp. F0473]EKU71168.1 hypothetical protein HMPREF9161_01262 [Selenomonas sp. F0473]
MATKKLRMTLGLEGGKAFMMSLADPKDGLTKAEVTTCLQNVIDKKAIVSGTAYPVSIKEIAVQTVETQVLA